MIWAVVTLQFEGIHCWPQAPDEVLFLKNMHRHMFHVKVEIQQNHHDRDVEYIIAKRKLSQCCELLQEQFRKDSEAMSCEGVAETLKGMTETMYPNRKVRVSVSEDGENGCLIED